MFIQIIITHNSLETKLKEMRLNVYCPKVKHKITLHKLTSLYHNETLIAFYVALGER